MGITRKTIIITEQENEWIKARIDSGDFTSDSEYIRDLIRRDQASQFEVQAIRGELIQGEESGEPQAFNGDLFKEQSDNDQKRNAEYTRALPTFRELRLDRIAHACQSWDVGVE